MSRDQRDRYLVDRGLARRLEGAEGRANADFVTARARAFPDSGAQWTEIAGAYAMFDGPGSPCTQTFGLGLSGAVTEAELEKLEAFFQTRGAEVFHEVCPLADEVLLTLLNRRGYQPMEFSTVLFQSIGPDAQAAGSAVQEHAIAVRAIKPGEHDLWAETRRAVGAMRRPTWATICAIWARLMRTGRTRIVFWPKSRAAPSPPRRCACATA
jgi:hypothetical protein